MNRRTMLKWLGSIALSPSLASLGELSYLTGGGSQRPSLKQLTGSTANTPATDRPQTARAAYPSDYADAGVVGETIPVAHAGASRLPIDGRLMNIGEFTDHIATLDLQRVTKVVIHHTFIPDEDTWRQTGGWAHWSKSLQAYYASLGWTRGPHLFISYEGIGLFFDMTQTGRGVGGGRLETGTLHIEMVGNFMDRLPEGETLNNTAHAAAALIRQTGAELTNHIRVMGKTECPGAMLRTNWDWFDNLVREALAAQEEPAEPAEEEKVESPQDSAPSETKEPVKKATPPPQIPDSGVMDAPTILERMRSWMDQSRRGRGLEDRQ
ncbi:MAG: peptidoglycan recognition family protein [Anaerolineae bacterium]|jgi:hypothetical protein